MSDDLVQQDKAARKALMSVLGLYPKTPRAAYETFKGGQSTDAEWETYGPAWERNWNECVELYEVVMKTEEVLDQAHEKYQNRSG